MGYVEENLLPGEKLLYEGTIHWIVYIPGGAFILIAIALYIATGNILGLVLALLGIIMLLKAHIQRMTTEFAVTDRRLIAKTGWVSRSSIEMNHTKIESIALSQTAWGRMLDYGTLYLHGTGGGVEAIDNVENPMVFRNKAMQAMETGKTHAQ